MGDSPKTLAKGQILYKEGAPARCAYMLESGLVQVSINQGGKLIEIYRAAAPQCIGDELLHGLGKRTGTAIALNDAVVSEIPAPLALSFVKSLPPILASLSGAILRKESAVRGEIQKLKLESDDTPCPARLTSHLFAVIHRVALYSGTIKSGKNGATTVVWATFRKYCQRIFGESPVRVEQAMHLLARLGHATLEMVKSETDPDGPEELGYVHIKSMDRVHSFAQTARGIGDELGNFPSAQNVDRALQLAEAFKAATAGRAPAQIDGKSTHWIPIGELANISPAMTPQDAPLLESVGLFIKIEGESGRERAAFLADGPDQVIFNCRVLKEILEWNRRGFVVEPPPMAMKDLKKAK